jgi:hypothetical protein
MTLQLAPLNNPPALAEDPTTLHCEQCGAAFQLNEARVSKALGIAFRVAQRIIEHQPAPAGVPNLDETREAAKLCWVCNHLRIGVGTENDPALRAFDAMLSELPQ